MGTGTLMATNHLNRPHYSNNLMLDNQGKPMTTISEDKVEWYLDRGLADLVRDYPGYAKVIRLRFIPKDNGSDEVDLIKMANQCVVCGRQDTLSLHHVTPYSVKRHFPLRDKEHTRRLCVLLCETHHLAIEEVNRNAFVSPYAPVEGHLNWINRVVGRYAQFLKRIVVRIWRWRNGGVRAINQRYIDLFNQSMKPQYLPEGWLKP